MSEIVLITISGKDKPGVTSAITSLLAEYQVSVLDIGQAVIHKELSLGMLVEIPEKAASSPLFKRVLFLIHEMDMKVRFLPISEENYREWTALQGSPRHIVTLLARKISAHHINEVTRLVADNGLNIDKITRLSGRVSLNNSGESDQACVEFSLRGRLADELAVRNAMLELANKLDIDIAYQEDDMFRRNRRLVVFDMDSTLIEQEVIDQLASAAGVGQAVSEITEAAMRGEIDFKESFRQRVGLLKGLDVSVLDDIYRSLRLTEGAERLLRILKRLGYRTAILSGGFNYFAERLGERLEVDYVFANSLPVKGGKVTGEVDGIVIDGARKAELLREIADKEQVALEQVIAVGDGANDLPMLGIAGLGVAFRAKPLVKASARQSISTLGLDSILYLLGISDRELRNE